jgi:hypothetical protein
MICLLGVLFFVACANSTIADELPIQSGVARQPLAASVARLIDALSQTGAALPTDTVLAVKQLEQTTDDDQVVRKLQELLDPFCIVGVEINPESRVKVTAGPARPSLYEKGWRTFLVKVTNLGGVTAPLRCISPQAEPMHVTSTGNPAPKQLITAADANQRWLDIKLPTTEPLRASLSGLAVEYRLIQLYSRDAGPREASLMFDVGQGSQDLGFRNQVAILFQCQASLEIPLVIRDFDGSPTTCSLLI